MTGVQAEEQGTSRYKGCSTTYRKITFPYPRDSFVPATSFTQQLNTSEAIAVFAAVPARCLGTRIKLCSKPDSLLSYLLIELPETIVK